MPTLLNYSVDRIEDKTVQDCLLGIREFVLEQSVLLGEFEFYEITFTAAVTNFKYPHGKKFTPKDVIQTSKTGVGSVTFNYTLFDGTNFDITTSGACVVRFLAGNISTRSAV